MYLLTDTVQDLRPPDFQVHAVLANGGYQIGVFYLNAPNFDIFLQTGDEVVVDVIHLVVAVHNYNQPGFLTNPTILVLFLGTISIMSVANLSKAMNR